MDMDPYYDEEVLSHPSKDKEKGKGKDDDVQSVPRDITLPDETI